ncbi:MAG: nitrate reductase cytochrome c-type subunit [Gammaproteobacteria bacterium]|nr:nitrate reductase cytochrome c-type subunit [Gammaproteobacteria bacterium]
MRKTLLLSAVLASLLSLPAIAVQDQAISEDSLGLYNSSVYEVLDPAVTTYGGGDVGTNKRAARSYNSAPPMITHSTQDMLPITRDSNLCKDCHVQFDMIGQKITKGMPIPAPVSHYVDAKKGELYMGRWNCTQCHRPQAKVDVLVKSTFKKSK